jgi:hypothetical protein
MFDRLQDELAAYRSREAPRLIAYTDYENAVKVNAHLFERFIAMLRKQAVPKKVHGEFMFTVHWPDGRIITYLLSLPDFAWRELQFTLQSEVGRPNLVFPAVVFRDAVVKNMFHHAGISKRCQFLARSEADLSRTHALLGMLEGFELGRYPFSWNYMLRLLRAYIKRWRELFVYAQAVWLLKVRRKPLYLAEEAILRGEF